MALRPSVVSILTSALYLLAKRAQLHRLRLRSEPTPETDENDNIDRESSLHQTEQPSADGGRNTSTVSTRFKASIPYRSGSLISTTSTLNAGIIGKPAAHGNRSRDDLGLHLVVDRLEPSGDIVFVHGLGGNAWTTWSWERDLNNFWPSWLEHEEALSAWRVFTFGYDSNWRGAGANLNISDFAKDLVLQLLTFTNPNGIAIKSHLRRPLHGWFGGQESLSTLQTGYAICRHRRYVLWHHLSCNSTPWSAVGVDPE